MSTIELKNNFHKLIDTVNDKEMLKYFYEAFLFSSKRNFLQELSPEETKELMESYRESENGKNLLDNEYVREKHKKWL